MAAQQYDAEALHTFICVNAHIIQVLWSDAFCSHSMVNTQSSARGKLRSAHTLQTYT